MKPLCIIASGSSNRSRNHDYSQDVLLRPAAKERRKAGKDVHDQQQDRRDQRPLQQDQQMHDGQPPSGRGGQQQEARLDARPGGSTAPRVASFEGKITEPTTITATATRVVRDHQGGDTHYARHGRETHAEMHMRRHEGRRMGVQGQQAEAHHSDRRAVQTADGHPSDRQPRGVQTAAPQYETCAPSYRRIEIEDDNDHQFRGDEFVHRQGGQATGAAAVNRPGGRRSVPPIQMNNRLYHGNRK